MKKLVWTLGDRDVPGWEKPESGGSSAFTNWATVSTDSGLPALTAGAPQYVLATADLNIDSQSGSDFSLADSVVSGDGALVSAAGGWFQFICYMQAPNGVTLDPGSTTPRYYAVGAVGGDHNDPGNPFEGFGIDAYVPVSDDMSLQQIFGVPIGPPPVHVSPGGEVFRHIQLVLLGATGTDEIANAQNGLIGMAVWQVG